MKSLKTATGNSVLRAYSKAVKNLTTDRKMIGSEVSAGFIIPEGHTGYQVFVKVVRFCKELLKKHPDTGGIIANFKRVFKSK
jgi:hypothetical protein